MEGGDIFLSRMNEKSGLLRKLDKHVTTTPDISSAEFYVFYPINDRYKVLEQQGRAVLGLI